MLPVRRLLSRVFLRVPQYDLFVAKLFAVLGHASVAHSDVKAGWINVCIGERYHLCTC